METDVKKIHASMKGKGLFAQEIFDTVVEHLFKQKRKSVIDVTFVSNCAYRSPEGLSCAIGCLISNKEYSKKIEYHSVSYLIHENILPLRFKPHIQLLMDLQKIHDHANTKEKPDNVESKDWKPFQFDLDELKKDLIRCAVKHNLKTENLEKAWGKEVVSTQTKE